MPPITFLPSGVMFGAQAGDTILDAARGAGLTVEVPCGGKGICKKCLVQVLEGQVIREDNPLVDQAMLEEGFVLACRTRLTDAPVRVRLLSDVEKEQGKFSEASEDLRLIDSALLPGGAELGPMVEMVDVAPEEPVMGDGLSDYDRFMSAFKAALAQAGAGEPGRATLPLRLLRALPGSIRESETLRVAYARGDDGCVRVVDIVPDTHECPDDTMATGDDGRQDAHHGQGACAPDAGDNAACAHGPAPTRLGIALDIGTTTVAVQLVNLTTGAVVASKTDYNGQIACGLDVISRINYAQKPDRLLELREKVLRTINGIIGELSSQVGADPARIYDMTVAANTTMVHLFLGIPPEQIRLDPYVPAVYEVPAYTAGELGIAICPDAPVLVAPSVGSYVGGDISAGLLCTSLCTDSEELYLFLDIGTNGELILGNNEFLLGCACSAGPAFEGGGITQGMRASAGAIERVAVDALSGLCSYAVIGGGAPKGICGSGMISLVASLKRSGWIDAAGQLDRERPCAAIEVSGRSASYIIEPQAGMRVAVSESDIQNIVRAKAAIFSACYLLLKNMEMSFDDLSGMVIAGGFGRYLDVEDAATIGLLPGLPREKVHFLGNTSVSGAYLALVSPRHRALLFETARRITYMDLSTDPGYMDEYIAALFLPHTDAALFEG